MKREINPNITNMIAALIIGTLSFLLWKTVLAPFDNPIPPEISPGPTGHLAPLPAKGLPSPHRIPEAFRSIR